ncbi:MAG: valine--tRNA ligase [Candidatus Magasanikbacteria bacterium RIFCSPHIGHO2_02_FULL_51_14]|uniref:Valine--tRNA ligase n=1 Tax=Candidatus Magasanikbacteria bacterium RIFCSPHIGHO2_02_FULL_51_14 TaxID=1798683 RepID=A0A1F6MQ10_9BACT|nr:MAG: valine--tRNA ligase [Candidatus Magasanikbacteria bacterium RIFCSPHIGHO2_02_FULL_51_14]
MDKAYEPKKYEDDIYRQWEQSGLFNPDVCVEKGITKDDAPYFSMVLPPPNVTGTLHMGNAVMLAIQDVMARYHRMKGDRTLWIPGTDHAAIATQSKVERILLEEEGKTRHDLGREKFLKRVEKFAQESHDIIVKQTKKMGSSLDWSREAFTLDEPRNRAVRTAFKMMYDDGLIYRGDRIVNWDPKMQSNVSDDEIVWVEEKVPFYYFQYGPFVIGTARPETKFGDKYVVMHPKDKRYKKYKHGDTFECEWITGKVQATVIKDETVDPEFGTGVMTITPWHDTNDFEIAERHNLDKEQIIDFDGKLLPVAGEFAGMDIKDARPKIVETLKQKGLLVKADENYIHRIATNYRGGGVIEPQIRKQWFVAVNAPVSFRGRSGATDEESLFSGIKGLKPGQTVTLKQLMQHVVKTGQIKIIPERFEKTYFHWIDNLRDWCISRQIWYGHRIPVYYCKQGNSNLEYRNSKQFQNSNPKTNLKSKIKNLKCDEPIVSVEEVSKCPNCGGPVEQDPDTLDTWFSSGLWTFSTLGWPEKREQGAGNKEQKNDLTAYHPTSVLETGHDILFFWVARMILMTTYALGEVPFRTVYLHGLVRDEQGRKMSKTLDNIIDPLDMIAKYGTDATRLSLLIGSTPGNDTKLSEAKVAGFRNFANKLWNISRFIIGKIQETNNKMQIDIEEPKGETLADFWILKKLQDIVVMTTRDIEEFNFSHAGEQLRDFTWSELADWYLEIAKIEGGKSDILNYILNTVLKLWHPFMPFVTEQIWSEIYSDTALLMIEHWPKVHILKPYPGYKERRSPYIEMPILKSMVTGIRSIRSDYKIEPAKKLRVVISAGTSVGLLEENKHVILGLARLENVTIAKKAEKPSGAVGFTESGVDVFVDLAGAVDVAKEKARIQKEMEKLAPHAEQLEKKMKNKEFIKHAPKEIVESEKKKMEEAREKLAKLQEQLEMLSE